jgi:RimJ/RimL family protein N-acetyltransferase
LLAAAADGELWKLEITVVPNRATISDYLSTALRGQQQGRELPFVIRYRASGTVCGMTRYRNMEPVHRRLRIGSTWLAKRWQKTVVNTEAKFLLLSHAFETWHTIRVELLTDVLNTQSRAAIERLGAKQEGILRNHMRMPSGRLRDSVCYSIIESEWPEVKRNLCAKLKAYESNVSRA